ncbi:hypothetical protein A176_004848 [Myxococcus hansupus]|uniref:Uncharacterized protein n=1 Tax=Pseudomyxococcus hansupus TaxID=1297742 RepID=A0A0H4WX10_9BACT|nr:hypothetical protein A176_004848 [Myxococcus hansupus]
MRPTPEMGRVEDVRTQDGDYDGYSVAKHLARQQPDQGAYGHVVVTGHGQRPIVVRQRTRRVDGMPLSGSVGLRIDPIVMRPDDPRGPDFLAGRILGLDYAFMKQQGWLFPCEPSDTTWLCYRTSPELITPSLASLDPLIAYLGRWMKHGGYGGTITISVWRPQGSPEEIRTPFGKHDGFTLSWAQGPDVRERTAVALTGHGTRLFAPREEGQPEAYEQRGNTAVLIGGPEAPGTALLSRSKSYPPYAVFVHVVSYADVDAAIEQWGRHLREGEHQGTLVIAVSGPWYFQTL